MCGLHRARGDTERGFLGLASKPGWTVSPGLASKPVAMVFLVWPQNHLLGFLSLGIKTGSCGLMIWPIKSSQQFLDLDLKTKWAMICWFLKTDGRMKTARDTHWDLVVCFAWKQVRLGFPNFATKLAEE
jgi:hypothetical protein